VARWPQGNVSQLDGPHEIYSAHLSPLVDVIEGVIERA
jgi:hypothetical protein